MKTIDDYFADWESHVFGYGYGTGERHVLPVLKRFLSFCPAVGNYDHEKLEFELGAPIAWLLINVLCHVDIIEYGTSPRFGWLSPQGGALKQYVDVHTADELLTATDRDQDYIRCYPDACNCGPDGYESGRKCKNPFW